jgi:uncharacterized protein YidB (DUF937 family)
MGLLDVLNGMAHGPRGAPKGEAPGGGGMSKTTMALLALLAYKAYKSFNASQPAQSGAPSRYPPQRDEPFQDQPGGLAGVLRTIFGGGSLSGPVLRRGVDNTVRDLDERGHGEIARSWVGRGPNRPIGPDEVGEALGEDAVQDLMAQTGMEREELLVTLSRHLPRVIDHLTPDGRIPTEEEACRMV